MDEMSYIEKLMVFGLTRQEASITCACTEMVRLPDMKRQS